MSTTPEDLIKRDLKVTNVDKYHEQGYFGEGITILNAEALSDHGKMTTAVLKRVAPKANIINGTFSGGVKNGQLVDYGIIIDNTKISLEEAICKYNIKVVTRSYAGNTPEAVLNYYKEIQDKYGLIFLCSAGNDGSDGVRGIWSKNNTAIAVGAVYVYENLSVKRTNYSAIGEELDFVAPLGGGQGTSASSPFLTGMVGLLLNKYGCFNHNECVEVLKSISLDIGDKDRDNSYGYGLPVLPLTDKLEKLEELRAITKPEEPIIDEPEIPIDEDYTVNNFIDVEKDRWSKQVIDRCVTEGLLIGFEDRTFRPTEFVTREQFAQILARILDKIEGIK